MMMALGSSRTLGEDGEKMVTLDFQLVILVVFNKMHMLHIDNDSLFLKLSKYRILIESILDALTFSFVNLI